MTKKFYQSKIIVFNSLVVMASTFIYLQNQQNGVMNYEALAASIFAGVNVVLRCFTEKPIKWFLIYPT